MKSLIISIGLLALSLIGTNSFAASNNLATYDVINQHDEVVGEVVIEYQSARNLTVEHWLFYPDPSWQPTESGYPDPSWQPTDTRYPDPSWLPTDPRYPDPSWNPDPHKLNGLTLIKSEDGYRSIQDFRRNIQKSDRYIKKTLSIN